MPDWAPRLPLSADISFHAVPAVTLAVDLLLFSPPYAISTLPAFVLSSIIAIAYWLWVQICHERNGFYPYPIFDEVGFYGRLGLFAGSALVMGFSTMTLKWVYGKVNGKGMDVKAAQHRKIR